MASLHESSFGSSSASLRLLSGSSSEGFGGALFLPPRRSYGREYLTEFSVISDEVVALNRRNGEIEVVLKNGKSILAEQVRIATGAFTNAAKLMERRLAMYLYGVTAVLVEVLGESRPGIPCGFSTRVPRGQAIQAAFARPPPARFKNASKPRNPR